MSAIEQAIKDHVDVLNLSLGNEINGPDLPISLALNKAVDKGIVAVAASGNSGPNVWTVGSPGTASKAISVGASTPRLMIPTLIIEGNRESIRLEPMSGSKEWKLDRSIDVADGGLGRKEDLHSVKNKIALIKRGGITFTKKAQNALDAGAKAVLIYNNMNGGFIGTLEKPLGIPVASLPEEIGLLLKGQIEKGNSSVRVNLIEEQDRLATFSSRGPVTGTWEIKPDVVAPGVAINSTIPGGYMFLQGTSMAAPHVAGACALIKQAHPDWTPAEIKAALMNTARPIYKTENAPYRTYEQGAGRIQIMEAVRAESLVMPSSLRFGRFTSSQQGDRHTVLLNIENKSEKTLHYSFRIPEATDGLRWKFPLSFTLKPNERKNVPIVLAVDPNLFKKKIQDGRIELDVDSETVSIPYIYVLNEPNYPRVMGFDFGKGDKPGTYRYEVYLPGGAEQFGIALFDPQNFRFKGFLDSGRNLKKGIVQKEIEVDRLPEEGTYLAKVFAKKAGREDYIETQIRIINREP
ncbi:S8 family serine peptidase [Neobacillus sp. PS3-34]|uniref:S8 family serine peptidase n=1 Tax=Neobacillus sp. PS3-34 TaxID=3070678 RepID=UPI0027E088AD|nr:S8 family serine peptidase [Neobacillus sp. PS3-34]WML46559.1 S8 family serine peptidase [Neobacillus sp. PS3-34]